MDTSRFVGYFEPSVNLTELMGDSKPIIQKHAVGNEVVYRLDGFLSQFELEALLDEVDSHHQVPVGKDGYVKNYSAGDELCSLRSTIFSPALADVFFCRIKTILSKMTNPYFCEDQTFAPVGVNPAMRFIDYPAGGWLVPHYDFPYRVSNEEMTLFSLVVFLSSNDVDGATRFIRDHRNNDDSDWDRKAREDEVLLSLNPRAGDAILFPHKLLHEGQLTSCRKTILRTDIMFIKEDI